MPWILLFDPTSACNLHCKGCWAAEYGNRLNLTYEEMDKLVTEGEELGIHWYMCTGGEPMCRKNDLLKLAAKHQSSVFHLFTNGTLIDDAFCEEVKKVGNMAFFLSVEGLDDATDSRRGEGVFQRVMNAMDIMKSTACCLVPPSATLPPTTRLLPAMNSWICSSATACASTGTSIICPSAMVLTLT